MIQELEKKAFYLDEPLLEYVSKVAYEFWWRRFDYDGEGIIEIPYPQIIDAFGKAYIRGFFEDSASKKEFLDDKDLLATLEAFDLDISKFWYLCVLTKQIVVDYTYMDYKEYPTIKEDLLRLLKGIEQGELLKIGTYKIKSALDVLKEVAINMLASDEDLEISSIDYKDTIKHSDTYTLYLFHGYISWFLKPLKAKKQSMASKDKMFLISKMVYILALWRDKKFITEYDDRGNKLNHLKNIIKRYKDKPLPEYKWLRFGW